METQLFLGEPASKEEGGSERRGASAARGWGVRGGVRRAKGYVRGERKKRTAQNRFVTLCLHLVNQPFRKPHLYTPAADSPLQCLSARTLRSSLDVGSKIIQFPPFYSTSFSSSSTSTHPDAALRGGHGISDQCTGEKHLILLKVLSGFCTIHMPSSITYSFERIRGLAKEITEYPNIANFNRN